MPTVAQVLRTIDTIIHRILLIIAQLALAAMIAIVCVTVYYRFVLNSGIIWAEEAPRTLVALFAFIACAMGVRDQLHIGIGVIYERFPKGGKMRKGLDILAYLATFLVGYIMFTYGWRLCAQLGRFKMSATGLPRSVQYISMPIAGVIPGMLLGFSLMGLCYLLSAKYKFPRCEAIPKEKRVKILVHAFFPMMTLVIIMGGVALGVFTVTESAAVACVYTFLLTYVFFRSAPLKSLGKVLKNTLKTLAIVLTLIAAAKSFAYMMTLLRIPDAITNTLIGITDNKIILLLIINALLLFLGCFMDMAPLILIMTPILLPVVTSPAIGMHPIHFGIMLIFNLAVGLCTPPVGSALFVGCAIGKTPIERTSVKMLPLYAVMVTVLLLVTFIPQISMWLVGVIF